MTWEWATLSSKIATLACNILYTLVYLLSEWSFSVIRIHDKYHRQFLVGLALACKASSQIQYILLRFLHKLERVATSGDPLGILYKRKLQTLYRSEAVYALICSGKSLSSLSSLSPPLSSLFCPSFVLFLLLLLLLLLL